VKAMENKEIIDGEKIVLECMEYGYKKKKMKWRKDGKEIVVKERKLLNEDDKMLVIVSTDKLEKRVEYKRCM
jgi:hypothetical protein